MFRQPAIAVRVVPLALVMGTIFFLSHQTGESSAISLPPGVDKLGHMVIYGLLAAAFIFALVGYRATPKVGRIILFTLFFCFIYGVSDEFHQSFIVGRFVSGFDLLADCIGATVVSFFWAKYQKKFPGCESL